MGVRTPNTPGRRYYKPKPPPPKGKFKVVYIKTNGQRFMRTFQTEEARDKFITSAKKKKWRIE